MNIKPSASIRNNYNEISAAVQIHRRASLFNQKAAKEILVVMDIEAFSRREKMLKLREELACRGTTTVSTAHRGILPQEVACSNCVRRSGRQKNGMDGQRFTMLEIQISVPCKCW